MTRIITNTIKTDTYNYIILYCESTKTENFFKAQQTGAKNRSTSTYKQKRLLNSPLKRS